MDADEQAGTLLRFGAFEADVQSGELTNQGKRVRLQALPFQLLVMLLEMPGEVVTREQLQSRLWPQTTIDFDHGLNKAISKIREALGDSPEHPRFVETVARRGYRFLADVTVARNGRRTVLKDPPGEAHAAFSPALPKPRQQPTLGTLARLFFGFGLALIVTSAISWAFFHKTNSVPAIRALAVLPFENLSGDGSQDYLADGMTEDLIARLAQIRTLRVISRTSAMTYKHAGRPLDQIAHELHVDAVVQGNVSRAGERIRVSATLIDTDNVQLWAGSYDEDIRDTPALQNRITRTIAEQIRATLNPQEQQTLAKSKPVDPDAYTAYLKGRYFWNKRTGEGLQTAIDYFKRATTINPDYAEAYAGLADSYAVAGDWKYGVLPPADAFPRAMAAAAKALALDSSLGEAHASMAYALDLYGWDWDAAETEYKQAIQLNPNYATAHQWYSWHLFMIGRDDDALTELRGAESLDPLSLIIHADIADALCVAHRYDEAVGESEKTLKMDANFAIGHYELGQALAQKGMYDQAIAEFQKAISISGHSGAFDSNLGYTYAVSGRREEALKVISDLEARYTSNHSIDADIALIYVGLDDRDHAVSRLERAFGARFKASILRRPAFDPLRSDPRFQDLLRRMGLPTTDK